MHNYLSRMVKRTMVVAPAAAGSTAPKKGGSHVDMAGFEGVSFTALLPASTALVAMKAQGSTSSTAWEDLVGASVTTPSTVGAGTLQLDVAKPQLGDPGKTYRYIRPYITKTSTELFGGVLAEQYSPRTLPVSQPSSQIQNSTGDAKCVTSPGSTT